jgi:flagellar FliL protein
MAKNQPSSIAKLLTTMLAITFIVAASVGATLFYSSNTDFITSLVEKPQPRAEPLAKPIFTPLEPFTVTLRTEHGTRILYMAITLRMADETSRRLIVEFMPEVRDRILRKLAEQNAEQIQTPEGRARLVSLLSSELEQPYHPEPQGPRLTSVLFTAFVIQ